MSEAAYIHPVGWENDDEGFTYLIQGAPDSPVKIGSSSDPLKRLAQIQTGNPELLSFAGCFPGRALERELHERFADRRIRGEWFEPSVLDEIDYTGECLAPGSWL